MGSQQDRIYPASALHSIGPTLKPRVFKQLGSTTTLRDSLLPIGLQWKIILGWFQHQTFLIEMVSMDLMQQETPNFKVFQHPTINLQNIYQHSY